MAKSERQRDVERFLAVHVTVIQHLVDSRIFPSYQTAWRWMNRYAKKESGWQPRYIGGVLMNRTGKPTSVYCNGWTPNSRTLLHEVLLTDELIPYYGCEILRGPKVDPELRPDATVFINSSPTGELHFEMDNGTEHIEQIRERMEITGQYSDPVIWVFQQQERMERVMGFSAQNSYFKLYGHKEIFDSSGMQFSYAPEVRG